MEKSKKRVRISLLALVMAVVMMLTACGGNNKNESGNAGSKDGDKQITLRFFSNLPDRKSGQGLAEQKMLDNYVAANPNVKIDLETLAEEPFKNKLKAYMASSEPLDVSMVHGGAELNTLVQAGYVKEIDLKQYEGEKYNFLPGVFTSFTFDGKVYGLPRNSDYEVIYYNKKMFEDNGVKVPTTFQELLDAGKAFREKGISPMSINGKDLWSYPAMFQNIYIRLTGNSDVLLGAVQNKNKLTDNADVLKTAQLLQQVRDEKLFQDSFMTADYGASQNLFTQGKAAMWYMGSWEAGMASNEALPESFRNNIGVLKFPTVEGGKGKDTDLLGWNGGGYVLISKSKHPEEAKKLFDYMMAADQWAKIAWDTGAAVPAQKYELTGKETELQKSLTDILVGATSSSGALMLDSGTPKFKDDVQNIFGKFFAGGIDAEGLVKELQNAADTQK